MSFYSPKFPYPLAIIVADFSDIFFVPVRPKFFIESKLSICAVPQEKIAQSLLICASHYHIDRRHLRQVQISSDGGLCNALSWILGEEFVYSATNFIPSPIVYSDYGGNGSVVTGFKNGLLYCMPNLFGQAIEIASSEDADTMLVVESEFAVNLGNEEMHQVFYFLLASFPILGGEGIEGDIPDALPCCFAYHSLEGLQAFSMSGSARKRPLLRPSAVSIHDDAKMGRDNGFIFHPKSP